MCGMQHAALKRFQANPKCSVKINNGRNRFTYAYMHTTVIKVN